MKDKSFYTEETKGVWHVLGRETKFSYSEHKSKPEALSEAKRLTVRLKESADKADKWAHSIATGEAKRKPFDGKKKTKMVDEAGTQGTQSPSDMRARQQNQKNAANGDPDGTNVDAPDMPGKVMTNPGTKPPVAPNANQQMPNQQNASTQNAPTSPAGTLNKNAAAQTQPQKQMPQQPQQAQVPGQPQNASVNPTDEEDEEGMQNGQPANGQKQMVQNGKDAQDVQPKNNADVVPPTEKQGFKNTGSGTGGVTMMSTTRPVPKPEHQLMGSKPAKETKVEETALLKRIMKESEAHEKGLDAAAEGHPLDANPYTPGSEEYIHWHHAHSKLSPYFEPKSRNVMVDEEEMPDEPHARLLGYVIHDNQGHMHGRKWIQNPHGHGGKDEGGEPTIYKNKKEAEKLAKSWTEREKEQDELFLDSITYTVGAAYSDGTFKFPA